MEMSQMVTQALWERDSPLLQLPGVTPELAAAAGGKDVEGVFGLIDMDDEERRELLQVGARGGVWAARAAAGRHPTSPRVCRGHPKQPPSRPARPHRPPSLLLPSPRHPQMTDAQLGALQAVCARYPDISLTYDGPPGGSVEAGDQSVINVSLERDTEGLKMGPGCELPPVHAPRFPGRRDEGWWLVLGDPKANKLLAIKRVSLAAASKVKLAFEAPPEVGDAKLTLFFMCDSWLGCDQEYEVEFKVTEAAPGSDSDDEGSE
jgi:pre-mRNA-splicing helicase BRR2